MIKVCGIKREEDIEYINELKPDYIGFVFAKSKREVSTEEAMRLKENLSCGIKTVGIFVNKGVSDALDTAEKVKLDVIQLHGDEDNTYIRDMKLEMSNRGMNQEIEIWKAIRVRDERSLEDIYKLEVDGILLDTYSKGAYGGLGECFNWNLVSDLNLEGKLILAGGLDKDNVRDALDTVKPDIIDVSSGVETDGVKDYDKIDEFIKRGRF